MTFGKALKENIGSIEEIADVLSKSSVLPKNNLDPLNAAIEIGGDRLKDEVTDIILGNRKIADSFIDLGASAINSNGFLSGLGQTFTGIAAAIKPMIPLLITAAAAFAAYEGFKFLDDKFTLTFGTAQKHLEESSSAYANTVSELGNLNSQTENYKSTLESIASKYDIEFSGMETLDEMIEKLRSIDGGLDLEDSTAINKLERDNALLDTRKSMLTTTASTQQKQAAEDARKSINFASEETYIKDDSGNLVAWGNGLAKKSIDRKDYVREQVAEMEKAQKQIEEAQDKLSDDSISKKDKKSYEKQFENATENLEKYRNNAMEKLIELNQEADNFYDKQTGLVISGYEDDVKEMNALNNLVTNFDLSPEEKNLSQIESFFDGSNVSNTLKDSIKQMLESGETDSATEALRRLGVTLNDLGITGENKRAAFDSYFDGLINSAEEAETAVKGIDGSVDGVRAAFASENQDSDWNSMAGYLKQAQELYENGKIGTDDFKAAAQFISPDLIDPDSADDGDAYAAAWEAAHDKIQRYFHSENPSQSAENFKNDLAEKNLAVKDGDDIVWNFKSSAEAADALGISIGSAETAMHNLEAYGENFDGIAFSGEELSSYKSTLEKIKALRDSMNNKDSKDRLNGLIDNWDSELERYQNDLSALTEDQVLHIEFEYEMAQLQSEIDELQGLAKEGDNTAKAALNYKKSEYREKREAENEYDESKDAGYANSYEAVEALQDQLQKTEGEENRGEIQDQISAIYDLQNAFQNTLADGETVDWETFLGSESAHSIIDDIIDTTSLSKDKIADMLHVNSDLFSEAQHISIAGDFDTSEIEERMETLGTGSTIKFTAEVDGEAAEIQAVKNVNGEIIYTANIDGTQVPISVTEKNGEISYSVNTEEVDQESAKTDGGKRLTEYIANIGGLPTSFPPAVRYVNYIPSGAAVTGNLAGKFAAIAGFGEQNKSQSQGTLLSPARADGTAYHMLNLKPAYAGGKVALSKAETALVNELGTESLIRDGIWSLLPGKMHIQSLKKGDIILNARQTRDLINSGKTNSYARAYAGGSLLNSYAGGSSYHSALPKASDSSALSASSSAAAISGAAEDLKDFIEIYLDAASDLTKKQIDAIDRAVGLANKQKESAKAISDVQAEISRNREAYSRYMQQADSIGLSEAYASQIRNGSLNIESITDETLSKNIKSYEEWYKKAKECRDKVTELQDKERQLAEERLEHIEDFYKLVTGVQEALQKANDAKLDFSEARGDSAVSNAVQKPLRESLKAAEEIYESLAKQLTDYKNEFNVLVSKGYIKKYSDEWYEGQEQIHKFTESLSKAGISVTEFQDRLREVSYTKIQQLMDSFSRALDKLKARTDLMKARDETVPEDIYQKQLNANNAHIAGSKQLRDAKLAEQALYAVDSKRYQKLAEEISKLDKETLGLMEDNEKLKDTIFTLRFTPLEEGAERMEALRGELKDFMGLLNKEAYFDKEGRITEEGAAALALLSQSMASAKQETADYREGLNKLQESFDNGVISETEFNKKSEEYRKGIRDAVDDLQDYSESLTDLYLKQMKQENESLQEIIDKRKDALKAKEAYYDYDKKLRNQSRDVNLLKAQAAALEGVNNTGAQAELKRLKQELADAEESLAETKRSHASDMQEEGYRAMSQELNDIFENTEYQIVHNADKEQAVIQNMLQNVVDLYASAYGKINQIIHNTGWAGSPGFQAGQTSLSAQAGAENQVSGALKHQSHVTSSGTAQDTVTSPVPNQEAFNQEFRKEIEKEPDTTGRPVAELTVSPASVILEEGKSAGISTSIRPSDAKNKKLAWKSSNPKTASVSGGTIRGIKAGSCQVTVSTTDGSGISKTIAVTVTKKPEPPKPQSPSASSGTGNDGDGIPRIGDAVTYVSGRYYYSSDGINPSGNALLGKTVYIGHINQASWATKPYAIYRDKGLTQGLGWVSLDQLAGYSKGTRRIEKGGPALFDETSGGKSAPGSEVIVTKYGTLKQFDAGDTVFSNDQVKKLYEWSKSESFLPEFIRPAVQEIKPPAVLPVSSVQNVDLHFDQLVTITDSTITKDSVAEMKTVLKDSIPMLKKEISNLMYRDARLSGVRKVR